MDLRVLVRLWSGPFDVSVASCTYYQAPRPLSVGAERVEKRSCFSPEWIHIQKKQRKK